MKYTIKPLEWSEEANGAYSSTVIDSSGKRVITYDVSSSYWDGSWNLSTVGLGHHSLTKCESLEDGKQKAEQDWQERLSRYLVEYKEDK